MSETKIILERKMVSEDQFQPHTHSFRKAFYLVLCAFLGALLFLVLQRAVALIAYLLLVANFPVYSLGLNVEQLQWLDVATLFTAMLGGLWYGTWLGLHWYDIVYEQGNGGVWHGFKGHWWHREKEENVSDKIFEDLSETDSNAVRPASTDTRPAVNIVDQSAVTEENNWDFDDLLKDRSPVDTSLPGTASVVIKSKVTRTTVLPLEKTAPVLKTQSKQPARTRKAAVSGKSIGVKPATKRRVSTKRNVRSASSL